MADKTRYLFYKAVKSDTMKPEHRPLPGQVVEKSDGSKHTLDHELNVVQREVLKNPEGQIFATDQLVRKNDYYVCGPRSYLLVNEKGEVLPAADADHADALAQYNTYKDSVVDITSKPKSSGRKPLMELIRGDKNFTPPTLDTHGFYVDTELWYYLLRNLWNHENVLLTGPTGTGKTELVRFVTGVLKTQCDIFDMAISNPTTALCGNHRINEAGHSEFQYARFATKIQEPGVKLLDELSRAAPAANNVLLSVLDDRRTLYVESAMGDAEIRVNEKACFWATANIGMEYVGTMMMDSALLNRFERVDIAYPPKDMMVRVLQSRKKIEKPYALALAEFADAVNLSGEYSKGVSPRQLLKAAGLVYDGYSVSQALEYAVLNQYEADANDGGERASVKLLLQKL